MCKFGTWMKCFVFIIICVNSNEVESAKNNVITVDELDNKVQTENSRYNDITDLNMKGKRSTLSLNVHRKDRTTPNPKGSYRQEYDPIKSRKKFLQTINPVDDISDRVNSFINLFEHKFKSSPREGDHVINSFSTGLHTFDNGFPTTKDLFDVFGFENEERVDQCYENYDCQQYLKYSTCYHVSTGNVCRCLPGYITTGYECLKKVNLGEFCKVTLQCPPQSFCVRNICICKNGYVKRMSECVDRPIFSERPNFLLTIIAGIVFLIVVSCLFIIIMALRRKLTRVRNRLPNDDTPTISAAIDARRPISPDPSYERIDKPPSYEEATSSQASLVQLNFDGITSEPPSYTQIQREGRSALLPCA